jgi:hypothetical protein
VLSQAKVSEEEVGRGEGTRVLEGFSAIYAGLAERVGRPGCHSLALRDYYPFWKRHNERSHAGKLLLLDPNDHSALHLFLDDNIGYDEAHIVDVRSVDTGGPVPFRVAVGTSLIKVEPLNAVLDNRYFCRTIETAVRRYSDSQAFVACWVDTQLRAGVEGRARSLWLVMVCYCAVGF